MAVGNRIKQIMREKGLNQSKLAKMAEVRQPTISKLVNGHDDVTLKTLKKLAAALDVNPEQLLAGAEIGMLEKEEMIGRLVMVCTKLPREKIDLLLTRAYKMRFEEQKEA